MSTLPISPYAILHVRRDATVPQLMAAYGHALKLGEFPPQELARALQLLRSPEERAYIDLVTIDEDQSIDLAMTEDQTWPPNLDDFQPTKIRAEVLVRPELHQSGGSPPGANPAALMIPTFDASHETLVPGLELSNEY